MSNPLVTIVLGTLVGPIMETSLQIALKPCKGDWIVLFSGPICITGWILGFSDFAVPVFIGPILRKN